MSAVIVTHFGNSTLCTLAAYVTLVPNVMQLKE